MGCSPIRVVLAIVVFLVLMAVYLTGLIVTFALAVGLSNTYGWVGSASFWTWAILGPVAAVYITYLIGFSCSSDSKSGACDMMA